MNYFYCDACHYCFQVGELPNRCPDCGAVEHNDVPAVRSANKKTDELLRIRVEDND